MASLRLFLLMAVFGLLVPAPGGAVVWDTEEGLPAWLAGITHYELTGFQHDEAIFPISLVFVGDPPEGIASEEVEEAVQEAMETWNRVSCATASFRFAGRRDGPEDLGDGEVPIRFSEGDAENRPIAFLVYGPSSDVLDGMWMILNSGRFRWRRDANPFSRILDAELPEVDLVAVLTHELGHVLGLAHTNAHNAATMAGGYLSDGSQAVLSADDKLGLCALYPVEGEVAECEEDADCGPGACVAEAGFRVCDKRLAHVGEYCGMELQGCEDFCFLDDPGIGAGYCTTACADGESCPEHFACRPVDEGGQPLCLFSPEREEAAAGCAVTGGAPSGSLVIAVLLGALVLRRRPGAIKEFRKL